MSFCDKCKYLHTYFCKKCGVVVSNRASYQPFSK